MTCIGDIRAHIDAMPNDSIVTSRDVLQFGFRRSVDKSLSRLVAIKFIRRIARGVFIKHDAPDPSPILVAQAKAKAFGKLLVTHGRQIACELKLVKPDPAQPLVFQVQGRSSSFLFLKERIFLKGVVAKKMNGGETKVGRLVRALCSLGRDVAITQLHMALLPLDARDKHLLIQASRWMPWWLADDVRKTLVFRRRPKAMPKTQAS
jgi:hypothetical protein